MGEHAVRKKLEAGGWNESQVPLVNSWLEHQESLWKDEASSPQARAARSAKNAAWAAAIAAIIAAIAAIATAVIAYRGLP
jgi:hypothetical protein